MKLVDLAQFEVADGNIFWERDIRQRHVLVVNPGAVLERDEEEERVLVKDEN